MKSRSPCLNSSVIKDAEVADIGHRKEDSDRVPVHEESLYSRLQKQIHSSSAEVEHGFYTEEPRRTEPSNVGSVYQQECPLRLTAEVVENTSESNGDSVEEERGIPDLTAEVDAPKTVDNVNSSNYKKGHYSTNACDSIRLSSTSQVHVQCLHTAEPVPEGTCQSRDYHISSPVRDNQDEDDLRNSLEQMSCASKRSKSHNRQFALTDERENCKVSNEESSCEFEDDSSTPVNEKVSQQIDFHESDARDVAASHVEACQSDDESCDETTESTKVIVTQKYTVDREVKSESCESAIVAVNDVSPATYSDSVEFSGLRPSEIDVEAASNEDVFKCRGNSMVSSLEGQNYLVAKSDDAYIDGTKTSEVKPDVTALRAINVDVRLNFAEGNGAPANFSSVQTASYDDLTGHTTLDENAREFTTSKRSSSKRKDASDGSSRSRKSQKRLSGKSKSKHSALLQDDGQHVASDGVSTKSHGKASKSKNRSTRSQRRDRERSATAEIGEADDDSGIQGDIYEFSEKESNLEDIGILSIIRRGGKHEARHHASTISSHLQEMQCNEDYSKTEPPVLVPEEPWPPVPDPSRNEQHDVDSNNGVQSGVNCNVEASLER